MHPRSQLGGLHFFFPFFCLALAAYVAAAPENASRAQSAQISSIPAPSLRISALQEISAAADEAGKTGNAYSSMVKLFGSPSEGAELTAFEENRFFVYAAGRFSGIADGTQWVRRVLFLKPSVFVVDDEVLSPNPAPPYHSRFHFAPYKAEIRGGKAWIRAGEQTILCETLFPVGAKIHTSPASPPGDPFLEVTGHATQRFLHVITLDANGLRAETPFKVEKDRLVLTLARKGRTFHFVLPALTGGAGEIALTNAAGKTLLANRPLPSGILPHSPEGIRLLEIWDGDYRDGRHPRWDTGQPSGDLKKAIEDGIIAPGRVVEFGCGTGTDAIYMASRGFDVTAIDISPSALGQALEKARKAGVSVRFMLADALNPPDIGKFDFIYDRACYHEVRGQNLNAYLETLRKASRPGTRMLLLAGNAGGPDLGFGPPTVTEEELRFDFLPLFDIEWLRESRFEVNPPTAGFPLAWSVLMRRKAD